MIEKQPYAITADILFLVERIGAPALALWVTG